MRREAAFARRVDDQQRLTFVLGKFLLFALDVFGGEVVGCSHDVYPVLVERLL